MQNLLGIKQDSEIARSYRTCMVEPNDYQNPPTLNPIKLEWSDVGSKWNERVADAFADSILQSEPNIGSKEDIMAHFLSRLYTLKKHISHVSKFNNEQKLEDKRQNDLKILRRAGRRKTVRHLFFTS
jgi:hypothetical protein